MGSKSSSGNEGKLQCTWRKDLWTYDIFLEIIIEIHLGSCGISLCSQVLTSWGIFAQNSAVLSPPLPPAATSPVKVLNVISGCFDKNMKCLPVTFVWPNATETREMRNRIIKVAPFCPDNIMTVWLPKDSIH